LVGIGSGTLKFDPVEVVERELIIVGCHAFQDELCAAIDLLETHPERFDVFIEHRIALEDTPEEYGKIVSGQVTGIKTLIEINLEQIS
jgi:(R,R)-butanediol dehydrogenase/meso-butanediol dehydrogenase/diacetyl reductase